MSLFHSPSLIERLIEQINIEGTGPQKAWLSFEADYGRKRVVITATLSVVSVPAIQVVTGIDFETGEDGQMKGHIRMQPSDQPDVTKRPVSVVVGGNPPVVVDMIDPNATFDCNPGDNVVATPQGDTNPAGTGPGGAPFSIVVPPGGGGGKVPGTPVITGIDFTDT